jgi:hypothetical protein
MHPLVARIHPSYRTAFVAWFVTRALLWLTMATSGRSPLFSPDSFDGGAPAWGLLVYGIGALGAHGPLVLAVLAELVLLAGIIGVYRFVRRDQLPQTADRATWLWAACPAMVWTLPAADWSFAIGLVAISLAALSASRHLLSTVALMTAMAFKPEAVFVWPGVAILGWKNYQAGKQHAASPWLTTLGPPAAFSGIMLLAMSMAGRMGVSLRTLQTGSEWRQGFGWQGFSAHVPDLFLAAAAVSALWMAIAYFKQTPKSWPLMVVPCVAWPFLQEPPTAAIAAFLFAVPLFAYLAKASDDPNLERPLLAAFVGGLLVLAL